MASPYHPPVFSSSPRAGLTARLSSPVLGSTAPVLNHNQLTRDATHDSESRLAGTVTPLAGAGTGAGAHFLGPGVSALAAALMNSLGTTSPRLGTPPVRARSPSPHPPARAASPSASSAAIVAQLGSSPKYGSFDSRTPCLGDLRIVKRHLVQPTDGPIASEQTPSSTAKGKLPLESTVGGGGMDGDEFSSLQLQGGDTTRGIYRWTEDAEARHLQHRRNSFDVARPEPEDDVLDIQSIKIPGGFRRNYIRRIVGSSPPAHERHFGGTSDGQLPPTKPVTSSFLQFLSLYGHFAGEELEEDDEVLGPDEYFTTDSGSLDSEQESEDEREPIESSALLTPSRRKRKRKTRGGSGNNSPSKAALLLLKSFVGTGVLFLPRAYLNGGMLFSNVVLLIVSALSYHCFVLLVNTRSKVPGSFGDIGGILYGGWMRGLILMSIVLSQIGFVAAYIVFTAESLQAFILAVTECRALIEVKWLILMQMLVFLPFSLLRDIGKLGFTALVADAFILVGLAYLLYFDVLTLSTKGLSDIILFNQKDWTLFIGTAIFAFEGVGLIIPIQESMSRPDKFPRVLFTVMIIVTVLMLAMGAFSYAAYGSQTETVVLLNLPQDNKLVNGVQLLYSAAILLSTPLQIFPAVRITENALFTRSGKYNPYIKWQKNAYRFFFVMLCAAISWGGADSLDKFVALVGNFACIPLVYIYPPLLHYRAVARSRLWKTLDLLLCVFGFVAMAYTTSLTLLSWATGPSAPPIPGYCDRIGH